MMNTIDLKCKNIINMLRTLEKGCEKVLQNSLKMEKIKNKNERVEIKDSINLNTLLKIKRRHSIMQTMANLGDGHLEILRLIKLRLYKRFHECILCTWDIKKRISKRLT